MIELSRHEFSQARALAGELNQAVLPAAVLEGINPGWVFADRVQSPRLVMIGLPCGYVFIGGDPPEASMLAELSQILDEEIVPRSTAAGNIGFVLSLPSPAWDTALPELLGERHAVPVFRRTFHLDEARFAQVEASLPALPPGYSLGQIDAAALAAYPALAEEIAEGWAANEDFLAHGLGVYITQHGSLASYCIAPFASSQAVEIAVATQEGQRRKGLARQAAAAFLRLCLDAGLRPNWECFWDNAPSTALAISLGFEVARDYPIFYWEETVW
jgi:RimJ/RimL family protein N-acetyltransferase